ncbi:MAG: hypothetical protein KBD31_00700 [Proteobacteria bacterium]|nr:hypothetical protein [Pseudomonadota bacterium]
MTVLLDENFSITDSITAKVYGKLRYNFLRSKAISDGLKHSNIERLYQVKGMSLDTMAFPELEMFWKKMEHYFKADELPILKILDIITGFHYPKIEVNPKIVKRALKKFRTILKHVDVNNLLEKKSIL